MIGDIFLSIRACQESPYPFDEVEEIQKYITVGLWVENEKSLFQMSLRCEPRERLPSRSPSWRHTVFTKPKKKVGLWCSLMYASLSFALTVCWCVSV
jgi:hypothetical protein